MQPPNQNLFDRLLNGLADLWWSLAALNWRVIGLVGLGIVLLAGAAGAVWFFGFRSEGPILPGRCDVIARDTLPLLQNSGDLPGRLRGYPAQGRQVVDDSAALRSLNTITAMFDKIKKVPGAWWLIAELMDGKLPGSGLLMNAIDNSLEGIRSLTTSLQNVPSFDPAASAIETYQANPTCANMLSLYRETGGTIAQMQETYASLHTHRETITKLVTSMDQFQEQVGQVSEELPADIAVLVESINQQFTEIRTPLDLLYADLNGLCTGLEQDVRILQAVHDRVEEEALSALEGMR